jgi:hypothetical protein
MFAKQVPAELLQHAGFVFLCLQQCCGSWKPTSWISRPQSLSTALRALENSSLQALLFHRHPQLATQCQEPATTHAS